MLPRLEAKKHFIDTVCRSVGRDCVEKCPLYNSFICINEGTVSDYKRATKAFLDFVENGTSVNITDWSVYRNKTGRKNKKRYTYNGESLTLSEFSEKYKIRYATLYCRIRAGWSIQKAITTPVDKKKSENGSKRFYF